MDFFDELCQLAAATPRRRWVAADHPAWQAFCADTPQTVPNCPHGDAKDLDELCAQAKNCKRCILSSTRQNVVFGEGNPHAKLMFIGEGPGADEDASGRPFVGRAGQLLDKMICAMQFTREEVYIANVVKCRPPNNRAPMPEEAQACAPFLKKQIELIAPQVIVLLGASAAKYLLNCQEGITRLRGNFLNYQGIPVMPTYHPAFLLRQESAKREAWSDLQKVMAKFGKVYTKK